MGLIEDALARDEERPPPKRIDYDRMNRERPAQKRALAAAVRSGDAERIARVCKDAVTAWDACGAWPDDWSAWQRALDDALPWHQHIDIGRL